MDCSLPGSSVHGILQAKILEWVTIPFSKESYWPRDQIQVSCNAGRFFTIWATKEAPIRHTTTEMEWAISLSNDSPFTENVHAHLCLICSVPWFSLDQCLVHSKHYICICSVCVCMHIYVCVHVCVCVCVCVCVWMNEAHNGGAKWLMFKLAFAV